MNKQKANELTALIRSQAPHVKAEPETANQNGTNWRVRVTFRGGTPDALSLTTCSIQTWEDIKVMWQMLPEKVGI